MSRPLFSIIIPCYNSKPDRINELLNSIYLNNCRDNIEVIISDDRSTDYSYMATVLLFKDNLNIKVVSVPDKDEDGNEVSHCPGNTREYGVREATGEWITFIDHDDLFTDFAIDVVKSYIDTGKYDKVIFGNIIHTDPQKNGIILDELRYKTNWIHGKYYNMDNFWKPNNIHFVKDLFSNEDVAVSSKINCIFNRLFDDFEEGMKTVWIDNFVYVWRGWYNSTSNILYDDQNYMEKFFFDYIKGTIDVYAKDYDEYLETNNNYLPDKDIDFYKMMFVDCITHMYFYIQSFKFKHIDDYNIKYEFLVKKNIKEYYHRFITNADELFDYVNNRYDEGSRWFNDVRFGCTRGTSPFIETDTFYDFISK